LHAQEKIEILTLKQSALVYVIEAWRNEVANNWQTEENDKIATPTSRQIARVEVNQTLIEADDSRRLIWHAKIVA
jgi:hypothetical protein